MTAPLVEYSRHPSLKDRVVLITGGGSGIGASMVEEFSAQGARVAFIDVQEDASRALVDRLADRPHPPRAYPCDLADIDALRKAIAIVEVELGDIGVLVNNAGRDDRHVVGEVSPAYWDAAMAVNLRHQFFAAQAVRPHMQRLGGGSIINLSSVAYMTGGTNMAVYTTAKAGVIGMTNSLAREFGPDNIRVNAIAPGAVMTERQLRLWYTEQSADEMTERQMIKRRLMPEEIARAAMFLASDDSAMITKQCLVVDAGIY